MDSPFADTHQDISYPSSPMPIHSLSFAEDQICCIRTPRLLRTAGTSWEFVSELSEKGVQEDARRFYVSESAISHTFAEKLGISFYRCVTQRRLIAAKVLIEKGGLLDDICSRVGFKDYSGFYRAIKHEYGISPRQYRVLQDTARDPKGW